MAKRSAIDTLPQDLRRQLDERLVAGQFSDYQGLASWLEQEGFKIGKSSIHRYGSQLEEQHAEALSDARTLLALARSSSEMGDAGTEIARTASTILQTDIVRTVLDIRQEEDPGKRAVLLSKLTKAQADIGRMSISAEKWQVEVERAARQKLLAEQEEALEEMRGADGLSEEMEARIRRILMGKE